MEKRERSWICRGHRQSHSTKEGQFELWQGLVFTLHRRFQLNELKRISNTVKPFLKPENKIARLKFCMSMLDEHWISTPWPLFKPMTDMVHIDEKWHDMTRVKNTYYVLPEESEPERTVQNTNNNGKVMFLTVVAKPRYNDNGEETFDGKIGTWAFVKEIEAVRTSQNRVRGTKELKSVKVTRNVRLSRQQSDPCNSRQVARRR